MVNSAVRGALEKMWKDRCSVFVQKSITDSNTHLTDFQETPLLEDLPCKLSFESLSVAAGDETAAIKQSVKLFLSPDITIPAGSKIIVTRSNDIERVFTYSKSGEPGIYSNHQEITLEPFRGWA